MHINILNLLKFTAKTRSRGEDNMAEIMMGGGGEDALLDSLVKTATQAPNSRAAPRERKRSRHADRKSCKYKSDVTTCSITLIFILIIII